MYSKLIRIFIINPNVAKTTSLIVKFNSIFEDNKKRNIFTKIMTVKRKANPKKPPLSGP